MRETIHVVSRRDYWPFAVAIREAQREWFLRVRKPRPKERDLERQADELRALMADGPRRHEELVQVVGPQLGNGRAMARPRSRSAVGHVGEAARAPLPDGRELGRPRRRRRARRARSPRPPLSRSVRAGVAKGHRRLVAPEAGRPRAGPRAPAAPPLPRRGRRRAARPAARAAAGSRDSRSGALPPDLGRRRSSSTRVARGCYPEEYRPRIFSTKMPQSVGTFLVDGAVAGTWRYVDGARSLGALRASRSSHDA